MPDKPEPPLSNYDDLDYDQNLETDCPVCGEQVGMHCRDDICNCILKGGF